MSRTYSIRKCFICGGPITVAGAAYTAHMRKHVRERRAKEVKTFDANLNTHIKFEKVMP